MFTQYSQRHYRATSRPKKNQRVTSAPQPRAEPENAILDRDHQPQLPFEFLQPPRAAQASESTPIEPLENQQTRYSSI